MTSSVQKADAHDYVEAAALREGAAQVFDSCYPENGPHGFAIYPFDGVAAYLIAATFWHLSGNDAQAKRALRDARYGLVRIEQTYPKDHRDEVYRLHRDKMLQMIETDEAGRWGVW